MKFTKLLVYFEMHATLTLHVCWSQHSHCCQNTTQDRLQ